MATYNGANSVLGACATLRVTRPEAAGLALAEADALAAGLADAAALAAGLRLAEAGALAADGRAAIELAGAGAETATEAEGEGAAPPPQAASSRLDKSPKRALVRFITPIMPASILGAMGVVEEQRRAPRTVVDVEALLHLNGLRSFPGVIRDLAHLGCLFVPEKPLRLGAGDRGTLRFALPTTEQWLEPNVEVRRLTTFKRMGGDEGQGIGMEFGGLKDDEEQAISDGCRQWDQHRMRQYELGARCYVQSEGGSTHYARFGQLLGGTRSYLRLSLPAGPGVARGIRLRLKMARTWVAGEVEQTTLSGPDMEVLVRIEGWGRDFFLHEARRQSLT
jgi:hypothetical protein